MQSSHQPYPVHTIVDCQRRNTALEPDRVVFSFLEKGEPDECSTLTNAQLDQRARSIARALRRLAEPGERILILCPPGLAYIEAFFGCQYAGLIAVPLYPPRLNRPLTTIQNVALDVQARYVLTTSDIFATLEARLPNAPALQSMQWLDVQELAAEPEAPFLAPDINEDSLAFFQYTSGSLSAPKGVMIRQGNLLANMRMAQVGFKTSAETVIVSWLPLFHDFGLILMMLHGVFIGGRSVFMPPMSFFQKPSRWLQAVSHFGGTYAGAPNFSLDLCVEQGNPDEWQGLDLSCMQVLITASELCKAASHKRFLEAFAPYGFREEAFYPGFGLAECCVMGTGGRTSPAMRLYKAPRQALVENRLAEARQQPNAATETAELISCGLPVLEAEVCIVDPETRLPLPEERIGEVWLKGPHIAQGYWNQPELSAAAFQARLADSDAGPYLRTGDLGFLHQGELYITGRMKEVIIIQGQNHYPQDIESTAQAAHEALQLNGGAAFGVDTDSGEQLVLVQEVKRTHRNKLDGNAVLRALSLAVAKEHGIRLAGLVLIRPQTLPKTSSGKIKRNASRESFLKGELQVLFEWKAPTLP